MAGRDSFTEEFIQDFVRLYAKYGRDIDCYPQLRDKYRNSYPALTNNQLTRVRQNRKRRFEDARSRHLEKVRKETSRRELHQRTKARDLNVRTAEKLMEAQEEYLNEIDLLDPLDKDFRTEKLALLRLITSIQREINSFSGVDLEVSIASYTQKLLRKKFIEEKDIEELKKFLSGEAGSIEISSDSEERIPQTRYIEHKEENEEDNPE